MTARTLAIIDYALGLLPDGEREALDLERRNDRVLDAAIADMKALLASSPIRVAGQDADRLFARIMTEIVGEADDLVGQQEQAIWHQERPGVAVRPLWNDSSFLIRCVPGTPIPSHVHEREERMVVLDGEMTIGSKYFATGACEIAPRHSFHEAGASRDDCLILIQYGD